MSLFFIRFFNTLVCALRELMQRKVFNYFYALGMMCLIALPNLGTAQMKMGLHLGGNLANVNGHAFRSTKKIGLQGGVTLAYRFNKVWALQAEPGFTVNRVRANDATFDHPSGIDKGNKRLLFFNVPILLKIHVLPGFTLLGGPEINKLVNDQKYRLNDGRSAFKPGHRLGYGVGLDLGKVYFRYKVNSRFSKVVDSWDAPLKQFQLGLRFWLI